jgi:hypothetical protein
MLLTLPPFLQISVFSTRTISWNGLLSVPDAVAERIIQKKQAFLKCLQV